MAEYIDREEVMRAVQHAWSKGLEPSQYIEIIPAADVSPVVHGRWIEQEAPIGEIFYTCSVCKDAFYIEMPGDVAKDLFLYTYCPSCGAKMDGHTDGRT